MATRAPSRITDGSGTPPPRLVPAAEPLPGMPTPPPRDPGVRLSFSRVDTYERCPLLFRFRYVDKLPSTPSPDLSWGSAIHAALEAWWSQKLPTPPPVEVLYRALYDHWEDTGFAEMEREQKLVWYRHARDVLARHHELYSANYRPAIACEQWFELDIGDDIAVRGSIDHVARTASGGLGIVDWKTNRRARSRGDVASSLQLAIYTLAARELWGREPEWVALDFVVPGLRVTVNRSEINVGGALARIRAVAAQVRNEVFTPEPSPLCDWCDYRQLCPAFDGDGPDVPGRAMVELGRLRRRRARDEARIAELERVVATYLGEEVALDLGDPDDD
ncbi:MAG: PD-(D/E)XK nuclease family protein [Actinobacteria bacterium]|nr:PD-(D/E)XK nuclease family protein [Actinomycetota bacterium]